MTIKRLAGLLAASLLFISHYSNAADQSNITFQNGSVLVICTAPEGRSLSADEFNRAFPKWISLMQTRANDGVITRAHYLGELKDGIFIVVAGNTVELAMTNAVDLSNDLNAIYESEIEKDAGEMCRFRKIGPVAILPQ